jgi:hypothetical protein
MVASPIFKLAGKLASRMASKADTGLPRIEKLFKSFPEGTVEKIAATQARLTRGDEAWARGRVQPPSRYRGPMEEVDEVILDAPLSRPERDYFANISKMKENYFGDMSFDIPPNKRDLSIKSNVRWLLRNLGVRNKNHPDYKETIQDLKDLLKDVKEFKHGGGLSDIGEKVIHRQGGGSGEPRTIAEAKSMGKNYFINKHGTKLAAVTKEELDKSGLSLGAFLNKQNKFNQLMRSITPGLKPTQDLPTPIQEKLGKGIKERDYRIINPLLDKRIKYSQQQDINNPPSDQPTSVSQQMDTMRGKVDRGRQEVDMRREMNKWINMGFVPSVHGSGADVAFDPVTGGSFVTIDDQAIDTISGLKHGGGLSSVNKPITINGQPHSLAWIRPDEASALKAMGGSGKKVGGIPAYDIGEEFDWSSLETDTTDTAPATSDDTHGTSSEDLERYGAAYGVQRSLDPETATGYLESYGGDEFVPQRITSESLREKGVPDKLVPYWNALKDRGMSNQAAADYLAGMEAEQLASMSGAYDTGYSFGGPMGTMQGLTRDMATSYAKKLKLKELEDEIEGLSDKLSSEERTAQIRDIFSRHDVLDKGKLTAREDYKGIGSDIEATALKHGFSPTMAKGLSLAAPGVSWTDLIAGAGNALAALAGVRGEFETEGGKTFRVMRGGELVEPDMAAIPTEDSPELVTETARAVAPTPEVVAEAGPMKAYQAGLQSIESNEGIENSIQILMNNSGVSESEARRMLGLDVNIA